MYDIKWIKITTDMFEDEKIDFISSLPEADAIIVIWIRILALAGKCNAGGYVFLTEKIPYTEEMLAHKFKKPLNVVKLALETFSRLEMLEMINNNIFLPNWEKHQNIDGMEKVKEYERIRKAKQRQSKKALSLPSPETSPGHVPDSPGNVTVLELRDKELDLEKDTTTTVREILETARKETATAATTAETVMDIHQKVFGTLFMNGLMSDYVNRLKEQGLQDTFIQELMLETGEAGTKPSLRLMETIGDRWIKEGIYTRVEAKRRRDEEKKKSTHQPSNQAPKESVPDPEILRELREQRELRGLREAN